MSDCTASPRLNCYVNMSIQHRVCLILDKALGKNGCEETRHLSGNSFYVPPSKNFIHMKRCFLLYFCLASLLSGSSHTHVFVSLPGFADNVPCLQPPSLISR